MSRRAGQAERTPCAERGPVRSPHRTAVTATPAPSLRSRGALQLSGTAGNRAVVRLLGRDNGPGVPVGQAVDALAPRIAARLGRGEALVPHVRAEVEAGFGADFSGVRVHRDAEAASLASALEARAFTTEQDVFFGAGAYDPDSSAGFRVLSHELAHTLQGGASAVTPRPDGGGALEVSDPADPEERAAEAAAQHVTAARGRGAGVQVGPEPASGSLLRARRCGDHIAPGCSCASGQVRPDLLRVRRYSLSELVDDVGAVASDVADTAENTYDAATEAVEGAVDTVTSAAGDAYDTVATAAGEAWDWMADAAGRAALAAAQALVARLGGTLTTTAGGIRIDIPEISLLEARQIPVMTLPLQPIEIPLLAAGAVLGPVVLMGQVGIELGCRPELSAVLGPASVRGVHLVIDPLADTYTASGQLHLAGSATALAPLTAALQVEVTAVVMAGEVPIPVEADVAGGLRLTFRMTGLGTLDNTVDLGYRAGTFFVDTVNVLKLGGRLDAALDASVALKLFEEALCVYTWPLAHWDLADNAEQFTLPTTLSYGPSGLDYSLGPVASLPIPSSEIDAVVPTLPVTRDCALLDNLIAALCHRGVLPPELCLAPGEEPAPGSLGFGPGHGGGAFAGSHDGSPSQSDLLTADGGEFPVVYRGGSAGRKNLTPRPGIDEGGLSTFERLDAAAKPGEKAQQIDTRQLRELKATQDPPPDWHVSIRPLSDDELHDWMASRDKDTEPEHRFTVELRAAIVREVKRPK